MSEDPVAVEVADDDTRRKCERCSKIHPKDKRYYQSKGKGYFSKRCLQCDYEVGKEGGLAVYDPKMGMDRTEYQEWLREEKKKEREAKKAKDSPPKADKAKPSWVGYSDSKPIDNFTTSSQAASSVPPSPPRGKVKVFNLDPEVKKGKGSTLLIINDYMRLDPKNIVSQRQTERPKVVDAPDPKVRGIPAPQLRNDSESGSMEEPGDEEWEEGDEEFEGPEMPINYHHELVKLCKTYPRLAQSFDVSLADIHNMSPSEQYQLYVEMMCMRGQARGTDFIKSMVVTGSMIVENTVKSSRIKDKVLLDGYANNVTKSEAIEECIGEICQKYSQEIDEYTEPEYLLVISLISEAMKTHFTNQDLGFKRTL